MFVDFRQMTAEIQYGKAPRLVTQEWLECKLVKPLWKMGWRLLKKLNIVLPYDPAIPILGICPKEMKTDISKRYLYSYVHCSIIYNI